MIETPFIETDRLRLEPLKLADAVEIQSVFPQWDIVRYLNNNVPWPYLEGEAEAYLRHLVLPKMRKGILWGWALRLKSGPERLIGNLLLEDKPDDNRGFWLTPEHWGQGLMSEACECANGFWFETLKMPILRVPKAVTNERSRQLSQREGMRLVRAFDSDYISGRLPTELWELTADEWRARRAHHSR